MSRTKTKALFGDGEHVFAMSMPEAVIWEKENPGRSLFATYRAMVQGAFLAADIGTIIRLGLIGGGMASADAIRLVDSYVTSAPIAEYQPLVLQILSAAFYGADDDMEPAHAA